MGTLDNYRSSLDYREILRILQKASAAQENFLWQSHAMGRNIIGIHHCEIDFVAREVVVYLDSKRFTLDVELPLYIKLDYRTSVFKVTNFRQNQNSVHFAFPEEIKTLELRSYPRHQFLPDKEKVISLKPSLAGGRDTGTELRVRALDISQYGLGLIVSEFNRSFLKNNRILWVTKLGVHHLNHPVLAEVVYINNEVESRYQMRKQKELKVGLKLSGIFPSDIYQLFIQ
jgi:hypothetical protein